MARSHWLHPERPKIRLQSDPTPRSNQMPATVLRARQGPAAACGGALRAPLTRARAAAGMPRCNKGCAFVANQREEEDLFACRFFLLTRGVQIRVLDRRRAKSACTEAEIVMAVPTAAAP
jgi:hypothetical protein